MPDAKAIALYVRPEFENPAVETAVVGDIERRSQERFSWPHSGIKAAHGKTRSVQKISRKRTNFTQAQNRYGIQRAFLE